jgi:hypothetical protein
VALGQIIDVDRAGQRRELAACGAVLAQRSHEAVDLADGRAGNVLDRFQRSLRALRVAVAEQPCGAGLHQDHVHGVARRVVQFARDSRALLGGGEATLALGLALGALGAVP